MTRTATVRSTVTAAAITGLAAAVVSLSGVGQVHESDAAGAVLVGPLHTLVPVSTSAKLEGELKHIIHPASCRTVRRTDMPTVCAARL